MGQILRITLSILALISIISSCSNRDIKITLNKIETNIKEHPDQALIALDSLKYSVIKEKEANAKFALLYTMA